MNELLIRELGLQRYEPVYRQMREFNEGRGADTVDELWFVQHEPVFTLGLAGKREHLLEPGDIPVHESDRGGQVTYHGPGQLVMYTLLDLRRKRLTIKRLVYLLEQSVIGFLDGYGIRGERQAGAPGIYVYGSKIAALGVRVRKGCCYHGLALNVDVELEPFLSINPCGYPGLQVTRLVDLGVTDDLYAVQRGCQRSLLETLDYAVVQSQPDK
ncbi:MAG: lipoyl(octanoyl) transferase LipB [Gammaproteobacteria bacterium]